jgi:dTDP-4-amino-4,6-dideoxygalactose transaminase
MLNTPFSSWPSFSVEEADAVARVLLSNRVNYWTGEECRAFEAEFAAWTGTRHAVALANGTLALEACLKAFDIGPGDEVIVTPRTFLASASCVISVGAKPVFADVDRDSQNITAETIAAALTPATRAIICVHLAGMPCEMDPIMALAARHGLKVIEDCAQAHGARYKDRMVGSIGHVSAWSFCQDKIMTTGGEGGMVTTDDPEAWSRIWSMKDHGKSWDAVYKREHGSGFRWLHESFGSNWRMIEMQAVIGRIQLRRMAQWSEQRDRNATRLAQACRSSPVLRVPTTPSHSIHANYKFYAFVNPDCLAPGWTRDRIIEGLAARGIPAYQGSCSEVYLEKAFEHTEFRPPERLATARELGETSVMLLVHPTLTEREVELTCQGLSDVCAEAEGAQGRRLATR